MRVSRVVVAVASAGVLALSACSGSASSPSASASAPASASASASAPAIAANQGRWEALPAGPLPALNDPVGVWTGDELVVVGRATTPGHALRAAAYRPATRSWRALPAPSSAAGSGSDVRTSGRVGAVWTGRQAVIIGGGFCHTLDPATGTWRRLTDPTGVTADVDFAMVWTGSRVLLWGVQAGTVGWSLDPATDAWTTLPAAPITPEIDSGVWTGSEFVVLSSANPTRLGVYQQPAAYDPAKNSWRVLPAAPQGRADPAVVWTGRELVVIGGGLDDNVVAKIQGAYAPAPRTTRSSTRGCRCRGHRCRGAPPRSSCGRGRR